jgi:hypothetical protein
MCAEESLCLLRMSSLAAAADVGVDEGDEIEEERSEYCHENDDERTIKILSIYITDKKLGVAYYDELTNSLKGDGYDIATVDMEGILSSLKFSCDPTIILIQPRVVTNQPLLDVVTSAWDGTPEVYPFHTMKNSFWNYENSIRLMCSKLIVKQDSSRYQSIESLSYQVTHSFSIFSLNNSSS